MLYINSVLKFYRSNRLMLETSDITSQRVVANVEGCEVETEAIFDCLGRRKTVRTLLGGLMGEE